MQKTAIPFLFTLLLAATAYAETGETQQFNLNTSNQDLGMGGLKTWDFRLRVDGAVDAADKPTAAHPRPETGPNISLDRFLFAGRANGVSLRVGHHHATHESLLFDGETDWGLSATNDMAPLNSSVSLFTLSSGEAPDTVQDMQNTDDTAWYSGGVWTSALPVADSDTTLWAGYVNGAGEAIQHQQGHSIGIRSSWFDSTLDVELEQATSRLSAVSENPNQEASDTAHTASLQYRPSASLAMGAETRRVGEAFHQPGNPSLESANASGRVYITTTPFLNSSMGYSYQELEQRRGQHMISSHGNRIFADLTLSPWGWLSLQPYGEFEHREYDNLDMTGRQSLFRLTADAWLIPNELLYRHTFRLSHTRGPDDGLHIRDRRRQYLGGELEWQALSPRRNRTGLEFNLSFSADHYDSSTYLDRNPSDYQVMLSISSSDEGSNWIW